MVGMYCVELELDSASRSLLLRIPAGGVWVRLLGHTFYLSISPTRFVRRSKTLHWRELKLSEGGQLTDKRFAALAYSNV